MGISRTCRREVTVSVRTPPRELRRQASGVARAATRVEAGRDKRVTERANTILIGLNEPLCCSIEANCSS